MRVALFVTCLGDTVFPQVGQATVELLERMGHTVLVPAGQTCCGQMHGNSGYATEATMLLRRFVKLLGDSDFDAMVAPSGSCAAMVRHGYPRLAAITGDGGLEREVRHLGERVFELSEFLVGELGLDDVGAYYPHRVVYHPSCHALRMLGVTEAPLRLLRCVRGLELRELGSPEVCCGFGGTFAVKNQDVSAALLADKISAIMQSGAEAVTALDPSCLMHIGGGLDRQRSGVRTVHLAQILAATES